MAKVTAADLLVERLLDWGVSVVFGLPDDAQLLAAYLAVASSTKTVYLFAVVPIRVAPQISADLMPVTWGLIP